MNRGGCGVFGARLCTAGTGSGLGEVFNCDFQKLFERGGGVCDSLRTVRWVLRGLKLGHISIRSHWQTTKAKRLQRILTLTGKHKAQTDPLAAEQRNVCASQTRPPTARKPRPALKVHQMTGKWWESGLLAVLARPLRR